MIQSGRSSIRQASAQHARNGTYQNQVAPRPRKNQIRANDKTGAVLCSFSFFAAVQRARFCNRMCNKKKAASEKCEWSEKKFISSVLFLDFFLMTSFLCMHAKGRQNKEIGGIGTSRFMEKSRFLSST